MELQHLTIEAYSDKSFNASVGSYKVMLNPETYTHRYTVDYSEKQASGRPDTSIKYEKSAPPGLSFDLIFDATGVVDSSKTDLLSELEQFRNIVYTYSGEIHGPNYLKLIWGKALSFQCRLTAMSVTYKLFRPDGTPIRAEVKVTFKRYEDPESIVHDMQNKSPDMSRIVTVVAGDTLPALTYKAYGESQHYLQVARFNHLDNFRDLQAGTKIIFPPLV